MVDVRGPGLGALLDPDAGRPAQEAVTTTVRDPPEFHDVHVPQVPGSLVLITEGFGLGPKPAPGGRIGPSQSRGVVAGQDLAHGRDVGA